MVLRALPAVVPCGLRLPKGAFAEGFFRGGWQAKQPLVPRLPVALFRRPFRGKFRAVPRLFRSSVFRGMEVASPARRPSQLPIQLYRKGNPSKANALMPVPCSGKQLPRSNKLNQWQSRRF